jgi:hypothetical protein
MGAAGLVPPQINLTHYPAIKGHNKVLTIQQSIKRQTAAAYFKKPVKPEPEGDAVNGEQQPPPIGRPKRKAKLPAVESEDNAVDVPFMQPKGEAKPLPLKLEDSAAVKQPTSTLRDLIRTMLGSTVLPNTISFGGTDHPEERVKVGLAVICALLVAG